MCKDCQREVQELQRKVKKLERKRRKNRTPRIDKELKRRREELRQHQEQAEYNENWAEGLIERGGSRSDRCKTHRQEHSRDIQGLAVAYIDFTTVGEVSDRHNPTGPLGGLGPLPDRHEVVPNTSYDLQGVKVGMTDEHITEMIRLLRDKQVLILRAGTGTGKSTFVPYRLMDPPPESLVDVPAGAPFARLTELGQIIVTEPRIQATVGVATFVGGTMSGLGRHPDDERRESTIRGVGPGYPVGYQVSGDRNHDDACELVYVTDGTMINWLRDGRLSRIGTVIVDEAHERSTNIDFILGYLKRELPRYPHLRIIVTSATFNSKFYQEYFGGPDVAHVMEVPAEKSFGYGMPLFPELDVVADDEPEVAERWSDDSLPLSAENPRTSSGFIRTHWKPEGPPFDASDVKDEAEIGMREDVWDTTEKLLDLRYQKKIPIEQWREQMPGELTKFVIQLAKGLDREGIYGDILGFLPTAATINTACEEIIRALGSKYRRHVFPLISSLKRDEQIKALERRRKGDPRKIVISTNLAETSLTVEGVRFIVDTGIIAQSEWDPDLASGSIPTKSHSQAGIKQRWGRVGRKAPGWVFPLYTKGQYLQLAEDTPPGSTRENLETLVMTAKMGGIDDVVNFPWPAAFEPNTTELDESALRGRETFCRELVRADAALHVGGALDGAGHPTSFGKELIRFQRLGSMGSALAVMYADRLACVPEVVTILALLEDARLIGDRFLLHDDREWPDEWRLEAAIRHRALADVCEDEAHLALLIMAAWERVDDRIAPWELSKQREDWSRLWFVNNDVLLAAAKKRREILGALSPAMKQEVKRFVEPALLDRARAVITRALAAQMYRRRHDGVFESAAEPVALDELETQQPTDGGSEGPSVAPRRPERTIASLEYEQLTSVKAHSVIALRRREVRDDNRISNLVTVQDWAIPKADSDDHPTGVRDAMRMVVLAAEKAPPDPARRVPIHLMESWPVGQRVRLIAGPSGLSIDTTVERILPFPRPEPAGKRDKPVRRRGARRARRRRANPDTKEAGATRDDSDGEINPIGSRLGLEDEDELDAEALEESDLRQGVVPGCGHCFPCVDGREEDCEYPAETGAGRRTDPLQPWLRRAKRGVDVSTPVITVEDDEQPGDGWYEVVGYRLDADGSPSIRVSRDWRPEGFRGNPAQHTGVAAGQRIEVTVGRMLRHHFAELRAFNRVDGQGRFLVREASHGRREVQEERNELAVSLNRRDSGLLAELNEGQQLTATVVPARVTGCYTITLLELLHQHLRAAAAGLGYENHVLDKVDRKASAAKVYQAVVESPPDDGGFAGAVLLQQDFDRGIKHRFRFNVLAETEESDDDGIRDVDELNEVPQLEVGQAVLLNLYRDVASIDVGGLDLDALKKIEHESSLELKLEGAEGGDDAGAGHREDLESDEELPTRTAAAGAVLESESDNPVTDNAARALAGLDDSADWQNDVWRFWAQSHHLKVSKFNSYLPGSATEPIDCRAEVRVSAESTREQHRRRAEDFVRHHPEGSVIVAEVVAIRKRSVLVKLTDQLEGMVSIRELARSRTEHPADEVAVGDLLRLKVLGIEYDSVQLSRKALLPTAYEAYKASHEIREVVEGRVTGWIDSRVFVDLPDGAKGSIYIGELADGYVSDPAKVVAESQQVRAVIKGFDDERRRVQLSLKHVPPKAAEPKTSRSRPSAAIQEPLPRSAGRVSTPAPKPSKPAQPRTARGQGRTIQAAVEDAASKLGCSVSEISYRTINHPRVSFFGRLKEPAEVEASLKS